MKNVLAVVYKLLSSDATVSDIVSNRIYPTIVPQKIQSPLIRTSIVSNVPNDTKSGVSTTDAYRVQVDCIDSTHQGTFTLASAVRDALDRYRGTVSLSSGNVFVDGIRFIDENAEMEFEKDLFSTMLDFQIRLHTT